MRVLLFHPYFKTRGGAEKLILEWIKRTKHDVDIYTLTYIPEMTFVEEIEKLNNFYVIENKISQRYAEAFFMRAIVYMYLCMKTKLPVEDYDALLISSGGLSELIAYKNRIPRRTVMYCHTPLRHGNDRKDIEFIKMRAGLFRKLVLPITSKTYNIVQRIGWNNIDFCFFNSNFSRKRALDNRLIDIDRTDVIYPGVDLPELTTKSTEDFVIYVSRFTYAKRQLELVDAFAKFVKKTKSNLVLCLVGCTAQYKYYNAVVRRIENHGIRNRVLLYPDVDNKTLHRDLYPSSLAGFSLGFREDFGIVPFEVLAYNKTLICNNEGGFMEILDNPPSTIFVEETPYYSQFVKRLYKALIEFDKNMDYYIDEAKNNREYVISKGITWERFSKELDEKLESVIVNENKW